MTIHSPLRPPRALARWLPLALLGVLPACDGGGGPTHVATALAVSASGRLERGSTVAVTATRQGTPLNPADYSVSVLPAGAAERVGVDSLRLLRAGHISITVTALDQVGTLETEVAAPPTVVFDRLIGGNRDIWRVDLDGANLTQLTTDTGDDQDPAAVKGTVVFVSYRGGNGDLYSVPLNGGATTTLTTTARDEMTPALSPDGQRLAFSYMATDVTKIYTSAANGSGPAALVGSGAGVIETAPSWSPSGSLAYVSTLNGSADIFQQAPGGSATVLTGSSFADVEPSWSPDGTRLAFVSNRNGGTDLFVLTVAGGAVTQLTSGAGTRSQPAWTADGRLVYLETLSGTTHLHWLDPAQPAQTHLIDTGSGAVGHPTVNLP